VRNLAVDVLRRKKLEGLRTSGNNATWVIPEAEQTPEEVLLFQESMQRAMDLLANLPEKQRLALQMHRFRGYPVERIASELGVSVQTVYRLVQSAVATITIGLGQDKVEQSASGLPKRVLSDKSRANDGD
jgi:RNA polymerase sigma-70 factor (ECF subfamily)